MRSIILIVEDEDWMRYLFKASLDWQGYDIYPYYLLKPKIDWSRKRWIQLGIKLHERFPVLVA